MKMKVLFFNLTLALTTALTVRAQTAIQAWAARYSNLVDSNDQASRAVTDSSGNVIVAGFSDDGVAGSGLLIIKYSNAGVALWTNRFAGPGSQKLGITLDASGNVFALT